MKKIVVLSLLLLVGLVLLFTKKKPITSFEECVAAGYPVAESYPPQCSVPRGATFTQTVVDEPDSTAPVLVTYPRPNQTITSPLTVVGKARGNWYFEASFPITVVDEQGNVLGSGVAQAQAEWMTEELVPFTAEVAFTSPTAGPAELVLHKSNPSDLPQNEANLRIPLRIQ